MSAKITKEKLLLVEGKDELNFFSALFTTLGVENVQPIESKGKELFPSELSLILNDPDFENVVSLGIVRDADNSMASAVESICYHLRKNNLPVPNGHNSFAQNNAIKVGIFIAPGSSDDGMLESLILESLAEHPVNLASNQYIENLKEVLAPSNEDCEYVFPRNIHKARMHAFLAGMEKFIPSAGLAAKKGYFDLSSHVFNDIKGFISSM